MRVLRRYICEYKTGSTTKLVEVDELDDGQYAVHRKDGIKLISTEQFHTLETDKTLPIISRMT